MAPGRRGLRDRVLVLMDPSLIPCGSSDCVTQGEGIGIGLYLLSFSCSLLSFCLSFALWFLFSLDTFFFLVSVLVFCLSVSLLHSFLLRQNHPSYAVQEHLRLPELLTNIVSMVTAKHSGTGSIKLMWFGRWRGGLGVSEDAIQALVLGAGNLVTNHQ